MYSENLGAYSENLGVYSENLGVYSENLGVYSENLRVYSDNLGVSSEAVRATPGQRPCAQLPPTTKAWPGAVDLHHNLSSTSTSLNRGPVIENDDLYPK